MAAHDVMFNVPFRSLGKSDIEFLVKRDKEIFGTLKISKGSLVWFSKGDVKGHKMYWGQFNKLMKNKPKVEKR